MRCRFLKTLTRPRNLSKVYPSLDRIGSFPVTMQSIPADQNNESTARITKLLYSRANAAEELSLSIRTVDTLIGLKRLRVIRVGRAVRIPWDALRAFTRRDHATSSAAGPHEEKKAA